MYMSICQARNELQISNINPTNGMKVEQGITSLKAEEETSFSSVLLEKLNGTYQSSKVPYESFVLLLMTRRYKRNC